MAQRALTGRADRPGSIINSVSYPITTSTKTWDSYRALIGLICHGAVYVLTGHATFNLNNRRGIVGKAVSYLIRVCWNTVISWKVN